ncbi:hypothetical protein MCEMSE15_02841 [Fimbriimonadaceae bacterium]
MRLLPILAGILVVASAQAQIDVAAALREPAKVVSVKDLPDTLRGVTIGSTGDSMSPFMLMGMRGGSSDPSGKALFELLGTVLIDPDAFAAGLASKGTIKGYTLDLVSMMISEDSKPPKLMFSEVYVNLAAVSVWSPKPSVTKESILKLEASMTPRASDGDSAPAAPEAQDDPTVKEAPAQVIDQARPASVKTERLNNAKMVGLALMMYMSDHDDFFPKAESSANAKALVMPYLKNAAVWDTSSPSRLLYNTALSNKSQTMIENPAETIMLWEENSGLGVRAVVYTDGHAKLLSADKWAAAWKKELSRRKKQK